MDFSTWIIMVVLIIASCILAIIGTKKFYVCRGSWGSGGRAVATPSLAETQKRGPCSLPESLAGVGQLCSISASNFLGSPCLMILLSHQAALGPQL